MDEDFFPAHEPPTATTQDLPPKVSRKPTGRRNKPIPDKGPFRTAKEFNRDFVAFNVALDRRLGVETNIDTQWPYRTYSDREGISSFVKTLN